MQLPAPAQKAWVALELELLVQKPYVLVMMNPKGGLEGSVERESGSCWPLKLSSCPDVVRNNEWLVLASKLNSCPGVGKE